MNIRKNEIEKRKMYGTYLKGKLGVCEMQGIRLCSACNRVFTRECS